MTTARSLRGTELRYALTMTLALHGAARIPDLIDTLEYQNFAIPGDPPKVVSDALRWEVRRDRVCRLRRGLYGPGEMPRSTEYYIHQRYLALREEAAALRAPLDEAFWNRLFGPRDTPA